METMSKKKLLVTGGAGFIGSHVAETALAAGWEVVVFDDLSTGRRENVPSGAELVVGDLRTAAISELLRDRAFDAVSHHAAQMDVRRSVADPIFDAETNVVATIRLLEALRSRPTTHVLFASSGGAIYGEPENGPSVESSPTRPLSPYGCSKLAGEAYLGFYAAEYALPVTIFRYANVYGPRQSPHGEAGVVAIFATRLLSGQPCTINGDGLQTRDYVFVGDVARANIAALEGRITGTFNVGTGVETSVVELYERIRTACGVGPSPLHGPAKPGEQKRSVVDASLLRRTFGLPGPVQLERGIPDSVAAFRTAPPPR
jgi:UDP-glucose 4-epimerase